MSERKAWTEHEDKILRLLKEQRRENKWSTIARKMSEQFDIRGRTGKQCRERYQNHLNTEIVKAKWTAEEQRVLERAHDELGNKWVLIARHLPGRSDNCVKNHFYSKLRRGIRQLNKYILKYFRSILSKIIEEGEKRFESPHKDTVLLSIQIKHILFSSKLAQTDQESAKSQAKRTLELIEAFEAKLKKQSKRHKESLETTYQQDKGEQMCDKDAQQQSFYVIFKRVCEEIMQESK